MLAFASQAIPRFLVSLAFLATASLPGHAQEAKLPMPTGDVILTIEGNIQASNGDGVAQFDREMLEALGATTIKTTTPWYQGVVEFEGVLAQRVLDRIGANGDEVIAVALNDYRTTIPFSDFSAHGVLLALKRNGEYMQVSEKGPIFIVYPFDSKEELQSQQYYARSAWQLSRLIIR